MVCNETIKAMVPDSDMQRVLEVSEFNEKKLGNLRNECDFLDNIELKSRMQFTVVYDALKVILNGQYLPASVTEFLLNRSLASVDFAHASVKALVNQMILRQAHNTVLHYCERWQHSLVSYILTLKNLLHIGISFDPILYLINLVQLQNFILHCLVFCQRFRSLFLLVIIFLIIMVFLHN